jgi:hypothetical protein
VIRARQRSLVVSTAGLPLPLLKTKEIAIGTVANVVLGVNAARNSFVFGHDARW